MATLNNNLTLEEYIQFRIDLAKWLKNNTLILSEEMKSKLQAQIDNRTLKLEKIQAWNVVIKDQASEEKQILDLFKACDSRERYQCLRLALEITESNRQKEVIEILERMIASEMNQKTN